MNELSLERVARDLIGSYDLDQDRERPRLPATDAVLSVLEQVRQLLFPGYYAEEALPVASRLFRVGTWLCQLATDLERVVRKAMAHVHPERSVEQVGQAAHRVATDFIEGLPAIRERLRDDAQAALDGDPAARNIEEVILTYPGFLAITVHRVAHCLHEEGVPYLPRAMSEWAHWRTGIDIHPGAHIGRRFFIDHGTGVVIGETTEIGDGVKIYQGVTLGALSVRRSLAGAKRHPTLGDGVVLYAGATVLGGETVLGEGAVIGGNVWLTRSVPPHTTVIESSPSLDYRGPDERAAVGV